MSERNENRPGYKKTKVGWIPEEWIASPLGRIANVVRGASPRPAGHPRFFNGNSLPWVTVADITKHATPYLKSTKTKLTTDGAAHTRIFPSNTLLLTNSGATLGVPKILKIKAGANDGIAGFLDLQAEKHYVYYLLQERTRYLRERLAPGVGQPNLNTDIIAALLVPLPPLPEQKKIAEILSTWDEAIDHTRRLIDAKKRCKKALMQQLLTGRLRLGQFGEPAKKFSRFPGDWQCLRARELFEVRSVKKRNNEPVLSVTQDMGVVPRDTVERKIGFSETNTYAYKLVEPGDFVISLRSFQGGIEYSNYRGIVSPAYHVIRPTREVDNTFYKYYFKCHDFIGHLVVAVIGIRDGKQVSYADFAFMYFPYPSIEEQKAIGEILSSIDEDIKVCKKKLTVLEKQKRGLMQKLLIGEVRVKT